MLSQSLYTNKKPNIYISVDELRFFPPCRTNRGSDNQPKSILINGGLRARISSQCRKSASREIYGFVPKLDLNKLKEDIKSYEKGSDNYSFYLSEKDINEVCGFKVLKSNDKDVALYLTLDELACACKDKKHKLQAGELTFDIDLYGREYMSDSSLKVGACSQFSHAISVQDVEIVDDYFGCRSSNKDNTGFITIQEQGLVSFLCYTHYNINLSELLNRGYTKDQIIKNIVLHTLDQYTLRFNGGVTGTAHNTRPSYFNITLGYFNPINHGDQFYVSADSGSFIENSIQKLKEGIEMSISERSAWLKYYGIPNNVKSFPFTPLDIDTLENSLKEVLDGI